MREKRTQTKETEMAKNTDTLQSTFDKFFGAWEDEDAGCAVRDIDGTRAFVITDAEAHQLHTLERDAALQAQADARLAAMIAQADDC
jgi:predicted secreted protein